MRNAVRKTVIRETHAGRIPVVTDASSCTEGFLKAFHSADISSDTCIEVVDIVSFTLHDLIPRLPRVKEKFTSMTLHPTCSTIRLGLESDLQEFASHIADAITIPSSWGCCAFAGDRGLLVPGLTQSATEGQAREVREAQSEVHASCNRTCEIGMSRATGKPYGHIVEYLASALHIEVENNEEGARA